MRIINILMLFLTFSVLLSACSNGKLDPVTPSGLDSSIDLPIPAASADQTNRSLLGSWVMEFNLETKSVSLSENRQMGAHINATNLLPPPSISLKNYSGDTHIADVNLGVTNPYALDAYDVRLIIYTDDLGHTLANPDAWTNLFDIPGGMTINPFKAFAKTQPNRKFSRQSEYEENLLVYLPEDNASVTFAIDASYPSNCTEPYAIENFTQERMLDIEGYYANISVDVMDWQNDIGIVYLYCPIMTGEIYKLFEKGDGDSWEMRIYNPGLLEGEYTAYIVAMTSIYHPVALYKEVKIVIEHGVKEGWAVSWWSAGVPADMIVSSDDSIYIAGHYDAVMDFDPGPGYAILAMNGWRDSFLVKFNNEGVLEWAKGWGGESRDGATALTEDSEGNILVCGFFSDVVDFDPGDGVNELTAVSGEDGFLTKFSPDGAFITAVPFNAVDNGNGGTDPPKVIRTCGHNNIFVAGNFAGTVDFDPGAGVYECTSNGLSDCCAIVLDPNFNFLGAITWGGIGYDTCEDMTIDSNEIIQIAGQYQDVVDFDPGLDEDIHSASGSHDVFISRFESNGTLLKCITFGGMGFDKVASLKVDDYGNTYVAGNFEYYVDFDPGPGEFVGDSLGQWDVFASRFNPDLTLDATIFFGNSQDDDLGSMEVDDEGNITLSGCFYYSVDFDPSQYEYILESAGSRDAFISKYDQDYNLLWVRSWGGESGDEAKITLKDSMQNLIVLGFFVGQADFDPGPGEEILISHGSSDYSLSKFKPNGFWY